MITARVQATLPVGWQRLQLEYASIGNKSDCVGLVHMTNGGFGGWYPPDDVAVTFARLRDGMSRPDTGTWLHATYRLTYPGFFDIEYHKDGLPEFENPPSVEDCRQELRQYPRSEEYIPSWMREILAGR
ncbi:hypothetical protein [Nocardia sp. NPDC004722]